ncbi:hypothetical protein GCM10019016_033290 [Streptomyces prasinosporus]|uniref:Uncharacterized protein n=1 Tax=Streptomyces prasinosporus TaxID=68256 RepID=A0ABP6TNY6_9ACTN|nr:hypothetical protein GCM10010332_34860 [Streptomyces albogriseolus]
MTSVPCPARTAVRRGRVAGLRWVGGRGCGPSGRSDETERLSGRSALSFLADGSVPRDASYLDVDFGVKTSRRSRRSEDRAGWVRVSGCM